MEFEFYGEAVTFVDIDPSEFAGMTREDIAEALADMARTEQAAAYFPDEDQFLEAADEVLRELAGE